MKHIEKMVKSMTHALKTWPEYYKQVAEGKKNFEIRKMDRPFKVGEKIILQEWDNVNNCYTGRETEKRIDYILEGGMFGLMEDYCCMSLSDIESYA
jgi:hypothetical protein